MRGETEAGKRRCDHVKGILRAAAMRRGIGEQGNDLRELREAGWPAMGDEKRQRLRPPPARMDEMDFVAVNIGGELRKAVQLRFLRPPVEAVAPIGGEVAHERAIGAIGPAAVRYRVRQARSREAIRKSGKIVIRNINRERRDGHGRWLLFGVGE